MDWRPNGSKRFFAQTFSFSQWGVRRLATILCEKYGQHQPLNRQRDRYAGEGVDPSLSISADQVGACAVALRPLHDLFDTYVMAADRP